MPSSTPWPLAAGRARDLTAWIRERQPEEHVTQWFHIANVSGWVVWFLAVAAKTVGWFWAGTSKDWTEDLDALVKMVQGTPDLWSLGHDLVNAAICFTIAHEVGHIVLRHLEGPHAGSLSLSENDTASRISAMDDKDQEFEADAWAADALLRWAGYDFQKRELMVSVPALCFCLSAIKSEMTLPATNAIAQATANSHPPDTARAKQLQELAQSHIPKAYASDALRHFIELTYWVNAQLSLLQRDGMDWLPEYLRSKE